MKRSSTYMTPILILTRHSFSSIEYPLTLIVDKVLMGQQRLGVIGGRMRNNGQHAHVLNDNERKKDHPANHERSNIYGDGSMAALSLFNGPRRRKEATVNGYVDDHREEIVRAHWCRPMLRKI